MSEQINSALWEIIDLIKSVVNPIGVHAIIIVGVYCIMNHDSNSIRQVKGWLLCIVLGMLLINLAPQIVTWLQSIGA